MNQVVMILGVTHPRKHTVSAFVDAYYFRTTHNAHIR